MSFWGNSFIFNGVSSELYDLRIFAFDTPSPAATPSGGTASINNIWLYRREVPYFYGRYYKDALEFDMTVGSYSYIDSNSRSAIQSWLLGQPGYLPLRIVQDDMTEIVYNCIITESTKQDIGNLNFALSLHAVCDRPWAISYPAPLIKTYTDNGGTTGSGIADSITYYNSSVFAGYNKPIITFEMTASAFPLNYFSIKNITDNNRIFRFDNLQPGEVIQIDNDKGTITSSASLLRLSNFNLNFFRLKQGLNYLTFSGSIVNLTLTTVFARGTGA